MIEDRALLSEYLSESEELLELLLADLDSLAARSGDSVDPNLINRIFRRVHSLKGLSGMMGLSEVQALAHEFEDVLDDLRLGQLLLDEAGKAALQEAGAGLAALVGGAARGSATDEDCDRLRELLTAVILRSRSGAKKGEARLEAIGLSEQERKLLTDYEEHRISENIRVGRPIYAIVVQFEPGKLETRYRTLTERLSDAGELIATLPGSSTGPPPPAVAFKLLLATPLRENDLKRIIAPFNGRVSRMGQSTWRRAGAALRVVGRKPKQTERDETGSSPEHYGAVLPPTFAQESLQPLSASVRVELSEIDDLSGLAHELAIESQKLSSMADRFLTAAGFGAKERFDLRLSARRLERDFLELEERLVELRMVSLAQTFTRAARLAGRLARELGKSVQVELSGRETQLDKMIVDRMSDAIYHILRNAIDHGVELPQERRLAGKSARGKIRIEARIEGARAVIAISDDGRGVDLERVRSRAVEIGALRDDEQPSPEETLPLIFRPGFSTAGQVSPVSGRGVGLDAVERTIHELGGEIRVTSERAKGARFELAVPTTLVMMSAFLVRVGEWRYAINVGQIIELVHIRPGDVTGRDGRRRVDWRGSVIPLVELRYLLGLGGARVLHPDSEYGEQASAQETTAARVPVYITRAGDRHVAIAVDHFDEQREIIVKSLGSLARKIKGVTGAVDLEAGDVALVLDLPSLLLLRSMRL